jgi:hypothetical protein
MASLWGCPWMHLNPSGCSAPLLTCLLGCLQSGFCVLHRLWRDNLQSPKALRPLLGPFCAPDCVQACQGALTVILEPEPFRLRPTKYPLAVTMQSQSYLFCGQPNLGVDEMDSYLELLTGGYFQPPSHLPAGTAEPPLPLPAGLTAKFQISCFLNEIPPLLGLLVLDIPFLPNVQATHPIKMPFPLPEPLRDFDCLSIPADDSAAELFIAGGEFSTHGGISPASQCHLPTRMTEPHACCQFPSGEPCFSWSLCSASSLFLDLEVVQPHKETT